MAVSYTKVADNAAVSDATDPQFSQAVSMMGGNSVQADIVIFNLGGATSLTAKLEGSNDLENWTASALATYSALGIGFNAPSATTGIAWQYVRLRYDVVGTGTIIFSAGIATSLG